MSNNTLPFSDVYNNLGICNGLTTLGSYSIPSLSTIYNSVSNPTAPQSLGSGYFSNDIYSANYVQGQNGWKLFYNGNFEANNGTFRGNITATSGTIGGWTIGATTLTGGGTTLNSNGTITGGIIQTSATGNRVLLSGTNFDLEFLIGTQLYGKIYPTVFSPGLDGFTMESATGESSITLAEGVKDTIEIIAGATSVVLDDSNNSIIANGELDCNFLSVASLARPSPASTGDIYLDSTDHHFYGYNGSAWKQLDN